MKKTTLTTMFASLLLVSCFSVGSAVAAPGYWSDAEGNIWKNAFGQCWRTTTWTPEMAIAECEGIVDTDGDGVADDDDACPGTPAGTAVDAKGCELDSDGDGVVDSKDSCPGTAAGVTVDSKGCKVKPMDSDGDGVVDGKDRCPDSAPGASVDATGCERDSDGDGVVDSKDSCPGTAAGITVDAKGCEVDSDMDGVVDSKDSCAGTARGDKVDSKGCKLEEKIVLKGVNFETGSDALTAGSSSTLDDVAATLKRYSDMKVEVAGYTDNRGPVSFNQALSQKRAQSVVNYLVSQGVSEANLVAKGYGPSDPVASNDTAAGRAANRRVELHIVE